ncbi:MAG: flagellar FlbD family protein [Bacteroidales bacterium]|nr:flagellar FlbD family protein [Bacteroidales bacterium]
MGENETGFILVKKVSKGNMLINTSYILRVEKQNDNSKIFMADGRDYIVNHTFEQVIALIQNVKSFDV